MAKTHKEKKMKRGFVVTAAIAVLGLGIAAQADVFNLGVGYTNLEITEVGDPGVEEITGMTVDYTYNIGVYEVTAKQYTEFLNAKAKKDDYGLYNSNMADFSSWWAAGCNIQRSGISGNYTYSIADDWANRPVNYVSFWDACRFANWLSNGQGNGDTETGTYTLNGYNGADGRNIHRNANATWAVTSEAEWFKAAYYWNSDEEGYHGWTPYPFGLYDGYGCTRGDANYVGPGDLIGPYYRTPVGGSRSSYYGTYDQAGNVAEWNEAIVNYGDGYADRCIRGGCYGSGCAESVSAMAREGWSPMSESCYVGFRVSQVPEPGSLAALGLGLVPMAGFVLRRRRK